MQLRNMDINKTDERQARPDGTRSNNSTGSSECNMRHFVFSCMQMAVGVYLFYEQPICLSVTILWSAIWFLDSNDIDQNFCG
jgi:hypothetical protein